MKKLTIVVTHYKEPWETCKFLFDSIAIQHGIDFNDFDVLVVNDGEDGALDSKLFEEYPYEVNLMCIEHGGVSAARNAGIDNADGDYIMFCDCDDGFLNNYGLHLVLGAIQEGFDFLQSSFVEEQPKEGGGWRIFRRDRDTVFVHGKCYRKQFLIDKNIRFNTSIRLNEDSVFNKICSYESGNTKNIETPFYLWAWNGSSTVRKEREDLIIRTYDQVMKMRTAICEELRERGFIDEFFDHVCRTVADSYYDFNEPGFVKFKGEAVWRDALKEFARFWRKYKKDYLECDSGRIGKAMMDARILAYNNGLTVEHTDLKSWLKTVNNA